MVNINLNDKEYEEIWKRMISAIKNDHAKGIDGLKEYVDNFSKVIEKKGEITLTEDQKKIIMNASRDTYNLAKNNYKDTHLLGMNKTLKEKSKTVGAIFGRSASSIMCASLLTVGVPILGIAGGLGKLFEKVPILRLPCNMAAVIGGGLTLMGGVGATALLKKNYSSLIAIEHTIDSLQKLEGVDININTSSKLKKLSGEININFSPADLSNITPSSSGSGKNKTSIRWTR